MPKEATLRHAESSPKRMQGLVKSAWQNDKWFKAQALVACEVFSLDIQLERFIMSDSFMVNTEQTSNNEHLYCVCKRCNWRWMSDTVRMLLDAGMEVEAIEALKRAPPRRCAQCKSSYWQIAPIRNNDHLGGSRG